LEIDLQKEKERVKEFMTKLDESENNRKRVERQKEAAEKERDANLSDKNKLSEELKLSDTEKKRFKNEKEAYKKERDTIEEERQKKIVTIKEQEQELASL